MPLLDVENLNVTYEARGERTEAVKGLSFSIEAGESVALVGESGSGKSSAALAITKLLPSPPARVSASRVSFIKTDLFNADEHTLRNVRGGKIAYVFQNPSGSLNPVLTIGEQIREMIELHTDKRGRQADAVAVEWLKRVGIRDAENRLGSFPHEFSGGMQQRAMIAMAMVSSPSLLIADEPTSALDVTVQVQILKLLKQLQNDLNLSLLLISHDLLVVRRMSHRVVVLSKGEAVESGLTEQIFQNPRHPYTRQLLSARASMSWGSE